MRELKDGVSRRSLLIGGGAFAIGAALSQLGGIVSKADASLRGSKQVAI